MKMRKLDQILEQCLEDMELNECKFDFDTFDKLCEDVGEIVSLDDDRILSDEQIEDQYNDFKCTHLEIEKSKVHDDWFNVTLELEFPDAEHPDFDDYVIENLYYDREADNWGFDHWYPEKVTQQIKDMVLQEIEKQYPSEPFERITRVGKDNDYALIRNKEDKRYSICKLNGEELEPINSETYETEEEALNRVEELGL